MDNIDVKPSTNRNAVSVATDVVDGVHIPIYKQAIGGDGEANPVGYDNPIPVQDTQAAMLNTKLDELIIIQRGMLLLLEAAFENSLSSSNIRIGDLENG